MLPCELCWYARILMYPIVLLSLVGILKKKSDYIWYIIPQVIL
ncbi:disulfide bond formation protein B [bacterium]|nr:disulfide bond formation protein B [bacterium]